MHNNRKGFHGIHCFLYRICLGSHFNQKGLGTVMHIISVSLQIDASGEIRIILRCCQLHLKRKCQILLNIRIGEPADVSQGRCTAKSIKKQFVYVNTCTIMQYFYNGKLPTFFTIGSKRQLESDTVARFDTYFHQPYALLIKHITQRVFHYRFYT